MDRGTGPGPTRGPGRVRTAPWLPGLLLLVPLLGSAVPQAADPVVDALRREIARIIEGSGWSRAEWAVLAVSLDAGDTLFAADAARPMAPASNVKLLTTAAALHHLGPDFRWETYVLARGPVRDGRLHGDLILFGTGDPGISDRFYESRTAVLETLARQVRSAGIHSVEGSVVGDGSYFEGPLLHPGWEPNDLNDWFAAPVAALNFNENVVTLRIEPSPVFGYPPIVHSIPSDPGLPVANLASTGPGRLFLDREHPTLPIQVVGSLPAGADDVWRRLTVRDPARFAVQAFATALDSVGIRASGALTTTRARSSSVLDRTLWAPSERDEEVALVARHRSAPLSAYLAAVNKESHNLLAEATLRTLGRVVEGDGSFEGGTRVVTRFMAEEVGVDASGLTILDGSGLSAGNRVSPEAFVALMGHMAEGDLWEPFWESLPEAGNRRELARMYRSAAAGNLRAKTGTIRGVSALSGVVRSASGERIAFSIIGNSLPSSWAAKRIEDGIGVQLASFRRASPAAPASVNAEDAQAPPAPERSR